MGPMTAAVLRHVAEHPGCSRADVVRAIAPDQPAGGYRAVGLCVRAKLLRVAIKPTAGGYNAPSKRQREILHLTPAGQAALDGDGQPPT